MLTALMALAVVALLAPHVATLIGSCLGGSAAPRHLPASNPSTQDDAQEKGADNE